jgi:PAS domain S-box-containing protein
MAILTPTRTIPYSNESFADHRPEEIPKLNLFDLIHPEDRSRHQELLKQLIAKAIPHFVIEKRYIRPDGSSVWVRNSVSLAAKRTAGRSHFVCICEDVNDRKQAEQVVSNQQRLSALGRLASAIVHQTRNPLEAASNLIFLAQKSSSIEEARQYLTTAEEEAGRASNIATHGLHFSR